MTDARALAHELTETVVTALGSPDGQRVTHHKGVVLAGTFTATPAATALSRAAHFSGAPIRITGRLSNGFPSAEGTDLTPGDPRGLALKFYLPDGATTDLICQDWPVFPAGTPEQFRDLLQAQHDGPAATEVFLAANPDVAAASAIVAAVAGTPPTSWATAVFHSLNAFRLVNADGAGQFVRFTLAPVVAPARLSAAELAAADPNHLFAGLAELLPLEFRLIAQLAGPDDQTTDPSRAWPDDRERVDLGSISLTALDDSREQGDDVLVHDPMRLTDGIEPSDDPILRIRPYVYAESVERRSGSPCPVHLR